MAAGRPSRLRETAPKHVEMHWKGIWLFYGGAFELDVLAIECLGVGGEKQQAAMRSRGSGQAGAPLSNRKTDFPQGKEMGTFLVYSC